MALSWNRDMARAGGESPVSRGLLPWLRHGCGGGVMIEFAFTMPVIVGLLMGGVEFARFALVNQKLERVTTSVGDFVARADALEASDFINYFAAADHIGRPFDVFGDGNVVVTSVTGESNGPKVLWQQVGAGAVSEASRIGAPGEDAALPPDFTMDEGEGLIVTETWFDFEPMLLAFLVPPQRLYFRSIYRPRTTAILAMKDEG